MLVFMVMSYFYKYVYYSVNGETSDSSPREAETKDEEDDKEKGTQ